MTAAMKKNRLFILTVALYLVTLAWLAAGMTRAKFQDSRLAYSRFGAASFNAVVLGENSIAVMTDPDHPAIYEFGYRFATGEYRPGMVWQADPAGDTARTYNFSIANGRDLSTRSDATIEYTIALRTSGNLPLRYTLTQWIDNPLEEGEGHYVRYTASDPVLIERATPRDTQWYEYTFHADNALESDTVLFEIAGGDLRLNTHQLTVEWPVSSTESQLVRYMKEVELLQLHVQVASRNMLADDGYLNQSPVDISTQASGILILRETDGVSLPDGNRRLYTYLVDFAGFKVYMQNARFDFEIENGIAKGTTQSTPATTYDLSLKVPLNPDMEDLAFGWRDLSSQDDADVALVNPEYRLYNELDGSYASLDTPEDRPENKPEPQYRLYAVYRISAGKVLVNQINNPSGEGVLPFHDYNSFQLIASRSDGSELTQEDLSAIRFANKLEILVETAPVN